MVYRSSDKFPIQFNRQPLMPIEFAIDSETDQRDRFGNSLLALVAGDCPDRHGPRPLQEASRLEVVEDNLGKSGGHLVSTCTETDR